MITNFFDAKKYSFKNFHIDISKNWCKKESNDYCKKYVADLENIVSNEIDFLTNGLHEAKPRAWELMFSKNEIAQNLWGGQI